MFFCMRTKASDVPRSSGGASSSSGSRGGGVVEGEWEVRPGGMLVQKRNDADQNMPPPPTIRIRVKYGSSIHEIDISSQATFGELKKILTGKTGLHHEDQKLFFKNKERDSKLFLDHSGVKNKSKIVLVEDPISIEKRYLEMKKNAKMDKASKTISEITFEVDRLAREVTAIESVISKGGKIVENDIMSLTELLMNQLVILDGINIANSNVESQRKMQVTRVQKYVETLDIIKAKNTMPKANANHTSQAQHPQQDGHSSLNRSNQSRNPFSVDLSTESRCSNSGDVVITTQWETFESTMATSSPPPTTTTNVLDINTNSAYPMFNMDLLL
ncbi:chaperone [Lithospermum erythrorhizon]|uniref:Chaperone n=1 Tax=Lithospermum erythrorhizon TaxID=34254 RepID=A0AAV3RX81_LITER